MSRWNLKNMLKEEFKMAYGESNLSPADIAVLSGNTGRNNSGDNCGFGDGNGAW